MSKQRATFVEEYRYTLLLVYALAHYFNMSGYMSNRWRIEYEYYFIPVYELTGLTCHKTDMIVNAYIFPKRYTY